MNNNNNSGKGKESDITTKKGFLISLPGKKKDLPEGKSSINLAKPQSAVAKNDAQKPENKDNNNAGNKHNNKHPFIIEHRNLQFQLGKLSANGCITTPEMFILKQKQQNRRRNTNGNKNQTKNEQALLRFLFLFQKITSFRTCTYTQYIL